MSAALGPKRPRGREWTRAARDPAPGLELWYSGPVTVISSLDEMDLPDGAGRGPQWLVSVTHKGKRPKPHEVRRALRAFDMVGAEEDNHHPGQARCFFLVVDPAHRVECECKTDETVIVEPDGYRWSNSKDPATCRGCELERALGAARRCPIHG